MTDSHHPDKELLDHARQLLAEETRHLERVATGLNDQFVGAVHAILAMPGHLIVAGLGKSGLIGQKLSSTLASTGTPSFFIHASDALHGDLGMVHEGDILLAISHSGETPEVIMMAHYLKGRGTTILALTRSRKSSLGRLANFCLEVGVDHEICPHNLAPTSSTLGAMLLGDVLAILLLRERNFTQTQFSALHPAGSLGRRLLPLKSLYHPLDRTPIVTLGCELKRALEALSRGGFGAVIVVNPEGTLAGILCDGDVRRLFLSGSRGEGTVDSFMTRSPRAIQSDSFAREALEIMERGNKITVLPVVDGAGKVVGIIHLHDLVRAGLA